MMIAPVSITPLILPKKTEGETLYYYFILTLVCLGSKKSFLLLNVDRQ